jgi:hypothetical protein
MRPGAVVNAPTCPAGECPSNGQTLGFDRHIFSDGLGSLASYCGSDLAVAEVDVRALRGLFAPGPPSWALTGGEPVGF